MCAAGQDPKPWPFWGWGTQSAAGGCVTPLVWGLVSLHAAFYGFITSKNARNGAKWWDLAAFPKAACREGLDWSQGFAPRCPAGLRKARRAGRTWGQRGLVARA